ncbi:hypothetical protein PV08_05696 [Exophiala spinifera]|uniref:Alpha/beta hydrolase fold-3 domain-containing protein n=1 Tax=Exophiala spinifera TaxID=91928 RepID=A0A0D1ZS69_9EURO|nr:uncharacterized protein PV08_05696 [Exophiala spinifera]KIW15647.1 hypothetical protein PV08_05696 [Exophiala spinifera]
MGKLSQESKADLYEPDPNWTAFAEKNGYLSPDASSNDSFVLNVEGDRAAAAVSEAEFSKARPLSSFGYSWILSNVTVRDGASISVKISYPTSVSQEGATPTKLPVLFVTHGGGWVQGTHVSAESSTLWPLYDHFKLLIVSVEYRLAPEHSFPVWMDDSWDVLEQLLSHPATFLSSAAAAAAAAGSGDTAAALKNVQPDLDRVILVGSSAGGGTSAYLSQACRDRGLPIYGVVLNYPLVCDYRHLPDDCRLSYEQGTTNAALSSGEMRALWHLLIPSATAGTDLKASPLLGNLKGLGKHLVFVAGHDPLRDEALKYAEILEREGCDVQLFIYPGVPHGFTDAWELDASKRFAEDFRRGLSGWLGHDKVPGSQ